MPRFEERYPPVIAFGSRMLGGAARKPQRGTDVALFQHLWNALAELLDRPPGPALAVDGVFLPACAAAAAALQREFGLTEDGIVGPSTYFLLGHGVGAHTTYGGPPFGSRSLRPGDAGGDVYVLQNRLAVCGRLTDRPADGTFGISTIRALASMRTADQGPKDEGPDVGTPTVNSLLLGTLAGGRAIFAGRNGLDIAYVQSVLRACTLYAGPIDGFYRPDTVSGVRAFQRREGLLADGIVGPATFAALGRTRQMPTGTQWF